MKIITQSQITQIMSFRQRRLQLGLTLREVEEQSGFSNSYLSQLENGLMKDPSFYKVVKLHNFYRKLELKDKRKLKLKPKHKK